MPNSEFVWIGGSGCFLPFLIIINLFFGKLIFNSTRLWLGIEAILVLLFMLKIHLMAHRISRHFGRQEQSEVVDIQGHVVEEDKKLK